MLKRIDIGVLYMLFAALISALNGAIAKVLTQDISALEVVFFRNLIGILLIVYALRHTPPKLSGGKIHLLILRGFLGFSAMILFFYTIMTIPLAEAITLNKTSPFFGTIIAFYILKEHVSIVTLFALVLGFLGIVFITKPTGMVISYEHFLGILGGFFAAAAYTTIKKIKDVYDARVIVLSFVGIGTIVPAILFLISPYVNAPQSLSFLFPEFILPNELIIWLLIVFMALISTLSQWLLTKAYSSSSIAIIGVVSYTNIPFAVGFGWFLGDAFPDVFTFIGISFIVFGGILVGRKRKASN